MKKFISQFIFVLFLSIVIFGQNDSKRIISSEAFDENIILLDNFGMISMDDLRSRIDNFTVESLKEPNTKARIRITGGNENYFALPYLYGSLITGRINNVKISKDHITFEYCNVHKEEFQVQFFLIKNEPDLPLCEENLEVPKKTVLFERIFDYYDDFDLTPFEESIIDIGPSNGQYSMIAQGVLKRLLNADTESNVYLIAYLGTNLRGETLQNDKGEIIRNLDKKSHTRKMLKIAKKELIKNGIKSEKIKTIEGGYVEGEKILEIWFVPKGGEIPKPKPDYFPTKQK